MVGGERGHCYYVVLSSFDSFTARKSQLYSIAYTRVKDSHQKFILMRYEVSMRKTGNPIKGFKAWVIYDVWESMCHNLWHKNMTNSAI